MHDTFKPGCIAKGCRASSQEKSSIEGTVLITWILGRSEIWNHQTYSKFLSLSQIDDIKRSASPAVIIHSLPNIQFLKDISVLVSVLLTYLVAQFLYD